MSSGLLGSWARQGADHLFEDPRVLPSSLNQDIEATIREVLLDGWNPRQITSAPVLATNYDNVDLKRLGDGLQHRMLSGTEA